MEEIEAGDEAGWASEESDKRGHVLRDEERVHPARAFVGFPAPAVEIARVHFQEGRAPGWVLEGPREIFFSDYMLAGFKT